MLRSAFIDLLLKSFIPDIRNMIKKYDYFLNGHIVNSFRIQSNIPEDIAIDNFIPLLNGFICNKYLSNLIYYVKNPLKNDIETIELDGEIQYIFVFSDIVIVSLIHQILIYPNFKRNRNSFLLPCDDYLSACIKLSDNEYCFGFNNGQIQVWNLIDKILIYNLQFHTEEVRALLLLPNGKLISGFNDDNIVCWNLETQRIDFTYNIRHTVFKLFLISGNRIVIIDNYVNSNISIFNYETKSLLTKKLDNDKLLQLKILSNDEIIYYENDIILFLSPDTLGIIRVIYDNSEISSICLLLDERLIVKSDKLNVYNPKTGILENTYPLIDTSNNNSEIILLSNGLIAILTDNIIEIHN